MKKTKKDAKSKKKEYYNKEQESEKQEEYYSKEEDTDFA